MSKKVSLFLDSGAFSAKTKGVEINLQEYIKFIKDNDDYIDHYANLDVIGSAEKSFENQLTMEKAGLHPIPCFHYGEPVEYLKRYIDKYDYIALGGMVIGSTTALTDWLDYIFAEFICDKKTFLPKVKVHGFGMTSLPLMLRYPWFSVDSTSWVLTGRFGGVYVPIKRKGEYTYLEQPLKVNISNRSPSQEDAGQHFTTFSLFEQQVILEYFHSRGFDVGKSEYRNENRKTYKLKDGERWVNKDDADSCRELINWLGTFVKPDVLAMRDIVEVIVEPGLCNDYKQRDELNIIYFLDLADRMTPYPWPFKIRHTQGFGFK